MIAFIHKSAFFLTLLLLAGNLSAQDLLYKKDNSVINVTVISYDQNTVTYKIAGDTLGYVHLISTEELDSLILPGNNTMRYQAPETPDLKQVKRNYIGVDLLETFITWTTDFNIGWNNLHLSYERLSPSGYRSFITEVMISLNPDSSDYAWHNRYAFWDGMFFSYDSYRYFVKTGINFYPFNYTLTRTGKIRPSMGLSLLLGGVKTETWDEYVYKTEIQTLVSIVWSIDAKWYVTDIMQVKFGIDMSVIPFLVFCSPEVGVTIGF